MAATTKPKPKAKPKPTLEIGFISYVGMNFSIPSDERYHDLKNGKMYKTGDNMVKVVANCGSTYNFKLTELLETVQAAAVLPVTKEADVPTSY